MRLTWAIRLLIGLGLAVSACAAVQSTVAVNKVFMYRSEDGKTAVFDTTKNVIRYPGGVIHLANCSDTETICLVSDFVRIQVPRKCSSTDALQHYIRNSHDLKFVSLEGLSGNVFKAESTHEKFGYGYHFENGVVQLIILPRDGGLRVSTAGQNLRPFVYKIVHGRGPFPCE